MNASTSRSQPFTADEWLEHAQAQLRSLERLFGEAGWKPDCSLMHGLSIAHGQINEARQCIRSESGYTKAGDAVPTPTPGVSVTAPISTLSAEGNTKGPFTKTKRAGVGIQFYDSAGNYVDEDVVLAMLNGCTPSHVGDTKPVAWRWRWKRDGMPWSYNTAPMTDPAAECEPLFTQSASEDRNAIIEECARTAYHARLDGAPIEYAIRMLKHYPKPVVDSTDRGL